MRRKTISLEPPKKKTVICCKSEIWLKTLAIFKIIAFSAGLAVYIWLLEEAVEDYSDNIKLQKGYFTLTGIHLIGIVLHLIFNVVLCIGIFKERPKLVQHWYDWALVGVVLALLFLIISLSFGFFLLFPIQLGVYMIVDSFGLWLARVYLSEVETEKVRQVSLKAMRARAASAKSTTRSGSIQIPRPWVGPHEIPIIMEPGMAAIAMSYDNPVHLDV